MIYVDNAGCLKRKPVHETGMVQHDEIRSFDHFPKNVGATCCLLYIENYYMLSQHIAVNHYCLIAGNQ
jgi:hypothetical protein